VTKSKRLNVGSYGMNGVRRRSSPEAQFVSRRWPGIVSLAFLMLAIALAIVAGKATAEVQTQLAILATGGLASLAIFRYLRLPAWCSLLLVTAVAARGFRDLLGLPEIVDFLHFPVVFLFALAAADRPPRAASRAPGRWLIVFFLVVLLSAVAHPDVPTRAALFLLIAGEPLVVVWAIARWGADPGTVRTVGIVAVLLAAIQIPIGVYQGLSYGWSDPVQGTLQGHGAGSHVLGALFALALFVVIAAVLGRRLNLILGAAAGALCLGMILATGSLAVLVIATLAAILEPLTAPVRTHRGMKPRGKLAVVFVAVVIGASALVLVAALFRDFYGRVETLATSAEIPGGDIVWERATSDPLVLLFGSGPGTGASRASLLLVDAKPGSPLEFLGLKPTDLGVELRFATIRQVYGGSAESAASSVLGVFGDLGLVGLAALGSMFIVMWRRAGRSTSWLAPAGRAALMMVAPLCILDNWLEYPEFAIPFAILMGFVLSDAREWNEDEGLATTRWNEPRPEERALA
jgi:hypothetical protein